MAAYPNSPRRRRSAFRSVIFVQRNKGQDSDTSSDINQILEDIIRAMCLSTITSSTGRTNSAFIHEKLGKDVLNCGCLHDISEFVLYAAFTICLSWSSGPEILIVRCKEQWGCTDQIGSARNLTIMSRQALFPDYNKTCRFCWRIAANSRT